MITVIKLRKKSYYRIFHNQGGKLKIEKQASVATVEPHVALIMPYIDVRLRPLKGRFVC